jgi:hypothetical protein
MSAGLESRRLGNGGAYLRLVYQNSAGIWQLDRYFDYLDSVREHLAPHVAAFALPAERYSLDSPHSLHDAWLESLIIEELAAGERGEQRSTRIAVRLLGAYRDRWHELTYSGVRSYRIAAGAAQGGHSDLLVHEVRIGDAGLLAHEFLFASGAVINLECEDLCYVERLRESSAGPAASR